MLLRTAALFLASVGAVTLTVAAIAQPPAPPPQGAGPGRQMAMGMPKTRTELQARLDQHFTAMDTNKDGKLSQEDFAARRQARVDNAFGQLDTNKDGSLSKSEFAAGAGRFRPGPNGMGKRGTEGSGKGMKHGMGRGMGMMGPGMMVQDGQPISKADFIARGLARFDQADSNHDGTISDAERDAARPMMRGQRGMGAMPPPPGQ